MRPLRTLRWPSVALVALLAWTFAVRVWFAAADPTLWRFWDERYGLANVAAFLHSGVPSPVNAFHPTLSYLPQALLLGAFRLAARWTGWEALVVLRGDDAFTPLAYLLVRLSMVVFGTLSVAWLVRVGRRVFDLPTGLLAGLLLAVAPWHIRQSALFKPDVLLVWLQLVAFDWSLRAVRAPGRGAYLRAGLGVGLAMAAKYNGGPAAIPLAVGSLLGGRPGLGTRLARLALAGAAAAATFLLLDLHLLVSPELFLRNFGRTLQDYAHKGAAHGTSHLGMVGHALSSLVAPSFHGAAVGAVALAGLAWMALRLRRAGPEERRRLAMLLSFPVAYVALYALATNNPSPHNWLPLLPFTSLAAADALVRSARWLADRRPALLRRWLPAAALVLAVALAARASAYAYGQAVPTTWRLADDLLAERLEEVGQRALVLQQGTGEFRMVRRLEPSRRPALVAPDFLAGAGADPQATDAEVWVGADREALLPAMARATARPHEEAHLFLPRPFRARGPALFLAVHRWRPVGETVILTPGPEGVVAAPPQGARTTAEVFLPAAARPRGPLRLVWGGHSEPLTWGGRWGGRVRFVSLRFPPPAAAAGLEIAGVAPGTVGRVVLQGWNPPPGVVPGPGDDG